MLNGTVRHPQNMISRFRPFPDFFNRTVTPSHGGVEYMQVYLDMLQYSCSLPFTIGCVVVTERTIPIRGPIALYRLALKSKCCIDISYNVKFGPMPPGLPTRSRGKTFEAVNNKAQGLFTTAFLKESLPTVSQQCERFGLSFDGRNYTATDPALLDTWCKYTGGNLDEFLLLNAYLLSMEAAERHQALRSVSKLKQFMENTPRNDYLFVAEVQQWRNNTKRTYIFTSTDRIEHIQRYDRQAYQYLRGLPWSGNVLKVSAGDIIKFLLSKKKYPCFFRSIELP